MVRRVRRQCRNQLLELGYLRRPDLRAAAEGQCRHSGNAIHGARIMLPQVVSHLRHPWRFEDRHHVHVLSQQRLQLVDQDRALDRVAAQLEEVVRHSYRLQPQRRLPQPHQHRFQPIARGKIGLRLCRPARLRRRQRTPIHFPTHRQGKLLQQHVRRRQHVLRQLPTQPPAPVTHLPRRPTRRHQVRHQPLVTGHVLARQHHCILHRFVLQQRTLNLAQLDAIAAQLHLLVHSSQVLQRPVFPIARQVSRAVQPLACFTRERMRHEPLCRQFRSPQIAPRQSHPTHVQLAHYSYRHRL